MIADPRYPRSRDITIEDKPVFQAALAQSPPQISEHTFTNLFIWNYYYRFLWCRWDECIWIVARPEGKPPFLLPPLGAAVTAERTLDLLHRAQRMEVKPILQRVPEYLVSRCFSGHDRFVITPDRDNSDYVP